MTGLRAWWIPEEYDDMAAAMATPVQRSLAETAEEVFRAQDLAMAADAKQDQQRRRTRQDAFQEIQDNAEHMAFMGKTIPSPIERFLVASDYADAMEAQERKSRQARQLRAQEERIAELEAQVAAERSRSERLGRNFTQANQGWQRARAEGASFRDGPPPSYYRNGGYITGLR